LEIRLSKKIQISQFEPIEFSICLTSDDIPMKEEETVKSHMHRIHLECYKELIRWQIFNKYISSKKAVEKITEFKELYKIDD